MFPDRLAAGRKILALLTVVRIHLRENKKTDTVQASAFLLRKVFEPRLFHFETIGSFALAINGNASN